MDETQQYKAYIRIRHIDDFNNVVDSIGLRYVDPNYVDRVMMGLMMQMDTDRYIADDSEATAAWEAEQKHDAEKTD